MVVVELTSEWLAQSSGGLGPDPSTGEGAHFFVETSFSSKGQHGRLLLQQPSSSAAGARGSGTECGLAAACELSQLLSQAATAGCPWCDGCVLMLRLLAARFCRIISKYLE